MPKKEKVWTMGSNGPIGPWVWHVWVKGKKKAIRIVAFDKNHIQDQLEGESIQKIEKLPEASCVSTRLSNNFNFSISVGVLWNISGSDNIANNNKPCEYLVRLFIFYYVLLAIH